jgi:pantothenate kinase-related protein Tda10
VIGFTKYVMVWWDQLMTNHMRNYVRQIDTWDEMKSLMKRRFMPNHLYRELYQRLQSLSHNTKSVDEYFKEIELAMIRSNFKDDREATMVRFMNSFNNYVAHIVKLHHYVELEEMVCITVKVEKQLQQKGTI